MLRPLGKNILVKRIVEEKKSILILTQVEGEPFKASVVDVGSKADLDISLGDILLLVPYSGSRIAKEDDGYLLVTERDILGVING